MAEDVSVIGDWNGWDVRVNKLNKVDPAAFGKPSSPASTITNPTNSISKTPTASMSIRPIPSLSIARCGRNPAPGSSISRTFIWHDDSYLKIRSRNFDKPMSIYECHLGSWKGKIGDRYPSYEEVADYLIPYVKDLGYTHIEIMPITQYPFDGSWGYQATGFYSVDSRYGNPKQLMSFVDRCHEAGLGVILDFAPVHFATDYYALREFDGSCLYEYSDPAHTFRPGAAASSTSAKTRSAASSCRR
jgi:1,4-alpha-glucan branching enzyme